jgi:hypothetical protein
MFAEHPIFAGLLCKLFIYINIFFDFGLYFLRVYFLT